MDEETHKLVEKAEAYSKVVEKAEAYSKVVEEAERHIEMARRYIEADFRKDAVVARLDMASKALNSTES